MEHGDSLFHQPAKSRSGSTLPSQQTNTYANIEIPPPNNNGLILNFDVQDNSKMPITNVTKITRRILPNNAKLSDSAKEMIQQSATKYITFVTRKAKERCQSEYRKIMNVEDVLWAMEKLGFHDYVRPLNIFLQRYRDIDGADYFAHTVDPTPCTDNNNGPSFGVEPNLVPTMEMLHAPLPPPVPSSGSNFSMDPNTNMEIFDPNDVNELYLEGLGVDCSDGAFTNFSPSALFKYDQV